jgi:hypothetical protein
MTGGKHTTDTTADRGDDKSVRPALCGVQDAPAARFLVISRVGSYRFYEAWLNMCSHRTFDVMLSFYRDEPTAHEIVGRALQGVSCEYRAGKKVEGYGALLAEHQAQISQYRHFCLIDDDLECSVDDLNRLFEIVDRNGFRIAQPALTHDSYFSYAAVLANRAFEYRAVTFVEMMCPVFRQDMLPMLIQLFSLGYETGIDLVWCNLKASRPGDYAIVDAVEIRHTMPVGSRKEANGFTNGMRYESQIHEVLRRFNLTWLPCVSYFSITVDGRQIAGRWTLLWASLRIIAAIPRKSAYWNRARSVLTHLKHVALKTPWNMVARVTDDIDATLPSPTLLPDASAELAVDQAQGSGRRTGPPGSACRVSSHSPTQRRTS